MSQPPDPPSRPQDVKAWVESLNPDEVTSLAQSFASGALGRRLLGDPLKPVPKPISLADPPAEPQLLTIRLSLDHSNPPVWRRLTLPGDLRLPDVHTVLQAAMGWSDYHLHRFYLDDPWGGPYFVTEYDIEEGEEGIREDDVRLDQILREPDEKLGYAYDFGDGWLHTVRLEKAAPMPRTSPDDADAPAYPIVCLAGARACPPEDVGGIGGYEDMADWVRHEYDRAHAPPNWDVDNLPELREWLPLGWHPDELSVDEVNGALRLVALELAGTGHWLAPDRLAPDLRRLPERLDPAQAALVKQWLAAVGASGRPEFTDDESAELTRPWRTVLEVVGEGLQLTNAGYLPPKVVETIFTTLDMDREWIGKGNREDLTPQVAHLREQTRALGLIRKTKGRLVPTARGKAMRDAPAELLGRVVASLVPRREGFERLATLVTLLAIGGGETMGRSWRERHVEEQVCRVLGSAGWARDTGPLEPLDVFRATRDVVDSLHSMTSGIVEDDAVQQMHLRLALAVLRVSGA